MTEESTTTTTSTGKRVGIAACKALALWALLYAVAVHAVMLWSWPPPQQEAAAASSHLPDQKAILAKRQERAAAAAAAAQRNAEIQLQQQQRKRQRRELEQQLQQTKERFEQQLQELETRQYQLLETAKQKMTLLQHNLHQLVTSTKKKSPQEVQASVVELPRLISLLSTPSLDQLEEEELVELLEDVEGELDEVMEQQPQDAWVGWKDVLKNDYPREAPTKRKCPVSSDNISPDMARESDLFSQVHKVEEALKQRKKEGQSPLLEESTQRVLDAIQQAAIQQQERLKQQQQKESLERESSSTETTSEENNCMEKKEVEYFMDEGLNALHRHLDLRQTLQRALQNVHPEAAQQVILDAVLLPQPKNRDRGVHSSKTVNLRRVLDTPLLSHKAPLWVDGAVDVVSGHNDLVDQTLDRILVEENDSVGKVLIHKLLNLAGKVNVPNPYANITTKAGILRP